MYRFWVSLSLTGLIWLTACTPAEETSIGFIRPSLEAPENVKNIDFDEAGRPLSYTSLGKAMPLFKGELLSGEAFTSDALKGQWTVIDVWGLWCSDCLADGRNVAALSRALAQDPNVNFLSIHTPASADRAKDAFGRFGSVEAYFEETGYEYPVLLDQRAEIRDALNIAWTPTYLLLAPDGTVQGFRTDLSATGESAIEDVLRDIKAIQNAWPG